LHYRHLTANWVEI